MEEVPEDPENEHIPNNIPALRRLINSLTLQKKEITSRWDFANKRTDGLTAKIISLERKLSNSEEKAEKLSARVRELELETEKIEEKKRFYKKENKELVEKLERFVDKEQMARFLFKNKSEDMEKNYAKIVESEKTKEILLKNNENEISALKEKVKELESELAKIGDLLEIEQEKNCNFLEKNEDFSENSINFLKKKPRNLRRTLMGPLETSAEQNPKGNAKKSAKIEYIPAKVSIKEEIVIGKEENLWKIEEKSEKIEEKTEKIEEKAEDFQEKRKKTEKPVKEIDPLLSPLSQALQKSSDKPLFQRNLAFLLENEGVDLQKMQTNAKNFKEIQGNNEFLRQKLQKIEKEMQKKEKELKNLQNKEISPIPKQLPLFSKKERNSNKPTIFTKRPFTQQLSQKNPRKSAIQQEISQKSEFLSPKAEKTAEFAEKKPQHVRVKTESTAFSNKNTEIKHFWLKKPNFSTYNTPSPKNFSETKRENSKKKAGFTQDDYQLSESMIVSQEEQKKNEEISENFAKFKYFYKYPFKEFENYGVTEENKGDLGTNEEFFNKIYKELCQKHESCGPDCGHLKRFYHRIRFMGKFSKKKELEIQKNYIDKLPLENSN